MLFRVSCGRGGKQSCLQKDDIFIPLEISEFQGYLTANAMYNLKWYQFNKDTRNMIRLMIKQSQKFNGICVAEIIKCNLETYIKVKR